MHNAFENVAATILRAMTFVAIDGDGGTYAIGLQSLGSQRSSATPLGADTTTTPVGQKGVVRGLGSDRAANPLNHVTITICIARVQMTVI